MKSLLLVFLRNKFEICLICLSQGYVLSTYIYLCHLSVQTELQICRTQMTLLSKNNGHFNNLSDCRRQFSRGLYGCRLSTRKFHRNYVSWTFFHYVWTYQKNSVISSERAIIWRYLNSIWLLNSIDKAKWNN